MQNPPIAVVCLLVFSDSKTFQRRNPNRPSNYPVAFPRSVPFSGACECHRTSILYSLRIRALIPSHRLVWFLSRRQHAGSRPICLDLPAFPNPADIVSSCLPAQRIFSPVLFFCAPVVNPLGRATASWFSGPLEQINQRGIRLLRKTLLRGLLLQYVLNSTFTYEKNFLHINPFLRASCFC